MKPITTVRAGGVALVFGAIAFMGVFSYLAARFDYPAFLDGPAGTVLPRLLATLQWAVVAAVSMMLGLMRWPSVHWHLAQVQATATPEQQQVIAAIFDGLNTYLGNYIGEFLGELSFSIP